MTIVGFPSLISYIHEDGEGGGFVSFLSNQHFLPFLSHFRKFFEYRVEFLNDFSFPMNEGFFFFFFFVLGFVILPKISVYMRYIQYKIHFCMLMLGQYVISVFGCINFFS